MLIIDGRRVEVPGVEGASFLDDRTLGFTNRRDYGKRSTTWVRNICVHTRMGVWPQVHGPSIKDRHWDRLGVNRGSADDRIASWHISIDSDGSYVCHLDIVRDKAYHCGQVNEYSIGIEMYQTYPEGKVTDETMATCVKIINVLTRELGIQRQYVKETGHIKRFARSRKPSATSRSQQLAYMPGGGNGADFVGVFGHRNATRNRGRGDPGDRIFVLLEGEGYEGFNVDQDEDKEHWIRRQERMGLNADGVPGPTTRKTIEADGQAHGIWIPRPGDDGIGPV